MIFLSRLSSSGCFPWCRASHFPSYVHGEEFLQPMALYHCFSLLCAFCFPFFPHLHFFSLLGITALTLNKLDLEMSINPHYKHSPSCVYGWPAGAIPTLEVTWVTKRMTHTPTPFYVYDFMSIALQVWFPYSHQRWMLGDIVSHRICR